MEYRTYKKKTYLLNTYFVVTERYLGTYADCFISEVVSVRQPLFTCGMTYYIPIVLDFTVLIDGWSCPVNSTLYEAPQNESEINKL